MRYAIGIDTGGTYTDAVIFDEENRRIISSFKAPTTHGELTEGILAALDGLDKELAHKAQIVCISTTLATNACVEGKGSDSRLIFLGVDPKAVEWVGAEAGLDDPSLILYAPREKWNDSQWDSFFEAHAQWLEEAPALGLVNFNAAADMGEAERQAKAALKRRGKTAVVCGHELSLEINSIRRGAAALLNGRLIPILTEFTAAIRRALDKRGITAPMAVMSNEGTLMSAEFTAEHPAATILCGPAAGGMGAAALTKEENAVVVDMGGTTTDLILLKNGMPLSDGEGIAIGSWHTAMKGVLAQTLGLGGDSGVVYDRHQNKLLLESRRRIPFCAAAVRWPQIKDKLSQMLATYGHRTMLYCDMVAALGKKADSSRYTPLQQKMIQAVQKEPLTIRELAQAVGIYPHEVDISLPEKDGVLIRCGVTPTDIMHIKGDFDRFDKTAAALGAELLAHRAGMETEELCDWVYDTVQKKLFCAIGSFLLRQELKDAAAAEAMLPIMEHIWTHSKDSSALLKTKLHTPCTLIGIGAPIHIFLPRAAQMLGTKCIIPPCAGVVNALGAAACHIRAEAKVRMTASGKEYTVFAAETKLYFDDEEAAFAAAEAEACRIAEEQARQKGAVGRLLLSCSRKKKTAITGYGNELFLSAEITAAAIGSISLL